MAPTATRQTERGTAKTTLAGRNWAGRRRKRITEVRLSQGFFPTNTKLPAHKVCVPPSRLKSAEAETKVAL
jgi:hypothetical protein